jgi:hypothetical protein
MLFSHNVLEVVDEFAVLLTKQTVFATVICSPPHEFPRSGDHHYRVCESRFCRALRFRIEMKSAALIIASYSGPLVVAERTLIGSFGKCIDFFLNGRCDA